MMFDVYCISQILAGNKNVTRRLVGKRRPAIPGRNHWLKIDRSKKTYGLIHIESCRLEKLGDLTNKEAIREGFNDKEHYLQYFRHINGNVSEDELVWRVEFELL